MKTLAIVALLGLAACAEQVEAPGESTSSSATSATPAVPAEPPAVETSPWLRLPEVEPPTLSPAVACNRDADGFGGGCTTDANTWCSAERTYAYVCTCSGPPSYGPCTMLSSSSGATTWCCG